MVEGSLLPHEPSVGLSLAVGTLTKLMLAVRRSKSEDSSTNCRATNVVKIRSELEKSWMCLQEAAFAFVLDSFGGQPGRFSV